MRSERTIPCVLHLLEFLQISQVVRIDRFDRLNVRREWYEYLRVGSRMVTALHLGLGELWRARANRRYRESVEHEKDEFGIETMR